MQVLRLIFLAALVGAAGAKLDTEWRSQYCLDVPCAHLVARTMAIRSIIAQQQPGPHYLAIGDSITEFAELDQICDRKPINAGIGWATADTFFEYGPKLIEIARPDFVVLAVGTNDVYRWHRKDFIERLKKLVANLGSLPVIVVPIPGGRAVGDVSEYNTELKAFPLVASIMNAVDTDDDGLHLSAKGYRDWKVAILSAAQTVCERLPVARGIKQQ